MAYGYPHQRALGRKPLDDAAAEKSGAAEDRDYRHGSSQAKAL